MPLKLQCPNCSQQYVVHDEGLDKRARCQGCQSTFLIRDAVKCLESSIQPQVAAAPRFHTDIVVLTFAYGSLALLIIAFLTYWFGYRDTWDFDKYSEISGRCAAVQEAIARSDDEAAWRAYEDLVLFIGDHKVQNRFLLKSMEETQIAYAPVLKRREVIKAQEFAAYEKRFAKENAERQRQHAQEAVDSRLSKGIRGSEPGGVDWAIVEKARRSWQDGNFRNSDRAERIAALIVITAGVRKSISDPLVREATLDYIQSHIDSW